MKEFFLKALKKVDIYYVVLFIITIIGCYYFEGHAKVVCYDWGREFTFPSDMLKNGVLYRDILNLFGPAAYLINEIIYYYFGSELKVHYAIGYFTSVFIISGIYFISNLFHNKQKSFIIALFSVSIGVAALNWSKTNYHFPYTYSIVYGLIFWYISVWLLIKGRIFGEKKFIPIVFSSLFAGLCASTKYEFTVYGILFLVLVCFRYRKNIKQLSLIIFAFLFLPGIQIGYLFGKGLTLDNLTEALSIMKNLINTPAYQYFYGIKGAIFMPDVFAITIINLILAITAVFVLSIPFLLKKRNKKLLSYISFIPAIISGYYIVKNMKCVEPENDGLLVFIPVVLTTAILLNIKRLKPDVLIFSSAALAISLKVFWSAQIQAYGNYFLPVLLIAFFAVIKSKKIKKAAILYILIVTFIMFEQNIKDLPVNSYSIEGERGTVYTNEATAKQYRELIDYINKNISKDSNMVILPECLVINYLTNRETPYFLYALQVPYVQLFGNETYIEQYKQTPPDYFILNIKEDNAYKYPYYCDDYAKELCNYINKEYKIEKVIRYELEPENHNSFTIYKKKVVD